MIWAADSTGNAAIDSILPFLNLGAFVVLVLMFVTKTGIVPKWSLDDTGEQHKREVEDLKQSHDRELVIKDAQIAALQVDKDEYKKTNEQLTKVAQEQFLPALIEANRLTALYVDTIARSRNQGSTPPSTP